MSGDNTVQSPSILTPVSSPPVQDALRRLMALPAWYEQFCPGPHPYANPDGKKQDSAEIMAAVSADIRAVCGEVAELREVINDLYPFSVAWVQHWTNSPSYGCGIPAKIHTQIIERAKKHVMLMEDSREGAKTQREGEK